MLMKTLGVGRKPCRSILERYVRSIPALTANSSAVNPISFRRARIIWPKELSFIFRVYYNVKKLSTCKKIHILLDYLDKISIIKMCKKIHVFNEFSSLLRNIRKNSNDF